MLLLIFNLAFSFPMSVYGSIITAYERFVFPRVINIIRIILNTIVMICLLKMGYKAITMVVVQTIFNVLTLIINYIYCKVKLDVKLHFRRFNFSFLKEVLIYSFWIFLNVIMDKIYWSTGQFVLGIYVSTVAVAVFAVSIQLQQMYMQFSMAISTVFLPKVTSLVANNASHESISDLFIRTGRIQFIVMSIVLSGFIVFGRQFINLWVGNEYSSVYTICILFFVSLLIPLIQNMGITILQARNQMMFRSLLYIVIAVIALILQIIFAKKWGGIGCAVAISGALLLGQGIIMNIYYAVKQKINIISFWLQIVQMSIVPLLMIVFSMIILQHFTVDSWGRFVSAVLAYCIIYIPLFWKFSMNQSERDLIINPLKKFIHAS